MNFEHELSALKKQAEENQAAIERLSIQIAETQKDEWPNAADKIWHIAADGEIEYFCKYDYPDSVAKLIARGNAYRTEAEAKSADEQIQWMREFLIAGDLEPARHGFEIAFDPAGLLVFRLTAVYWGARKFSTVEKRNAWIESHGGIDVVRERLARGWPV